MTVSTVAMAQPTRDHRTNPPPPVVMHGPASAPPALKIEAHEPRRKGFVWVTGRWDWKKNNWEWVGGHWERVKAKSHWRDGRWEQKGAEWAWVEGSWETAPERPVAAPPPPREEVIAVRPNQIFVKGHWEWENGEYQWEAGHYENIRAAKQWREAHWEQKGSEWVFVDGAWIDAPRYPTAEPPQPQAETMPDKPGFIWQRGQHEWKNGAYIWVPGHYERERAGQMWNEGKWERRGDHWEFVAGTWGAPPKFPTYPPPADVDETAKIRETEGRPGVWHAGKYTWENGKYVWHYVGRVTGHDGEHWASGNWHRAGDHYEWTEGTWVRDERPHGPPPTMGGGHGPTMAPPPPREEKMAAKAGFVWAKGHHEWKNGAYEWIPGHWEREKANKHWHDAEWTQRGNEWVFVDGRWE